MKKPFVCFTFMLLWTIAPLTKASAQDPITLIIKEGIKKVILAVDLQIQRLQNKTIWLQNAQKILENTMSKTKLEEISGWVEKQRTLYKDYYEELYKVKSFITYYQRVKDIAKKQALIVKEYKRAWNLFKQDKHFDPEELAYMATVYSGILDETAKTIDQVYLVVSSFTTQMSDAKRLEIINAAADGVDVNYNDLITFNNQNILLSLQRAKAQNDVDVVKKMYGL